MVAEHPNGIDVSVNKDGGIFKEILREGTGDEYPLSGDTVVVHYTGTLLDGTKFDSSRDRGEKFTFEVGKGRVIKGWDQGIPTMKRNELAKFTIRGDYAYGKAGSPPNIPPDATLVFEVELFDFHGEDISENKDKSIIKRTVKAGSGYANPNDGARVVINLKGTDSEGRVFDERKNLEFELGEGVGLNILESIESALTKFKKEEISRLYIKSSRAWGVKGNKLFNLPENADVIYEIELKDFEKAKESWQLNGKEKLEQSELLKNKGTELFKQGKYESALKKYKKINDFLQNETYDLEEETSTSNKLQLAANLNIAACYLKIKEFRDAIEYCNKALELDPKNEKGLYRIASAYFGLSEYQEAIEHSKKLLEIYPESKDGAHLLALSKQKIAEYQKKEKEMYSKMFSSIASK